MPRQVPARLLHLPFPYSSDCPWTLTEYSRSYLHQPGASCTASCCILSHANRTLIRELAFQISEQFAVLGAAFNLRTAVVVGGMDIIAQATELKNRPHVVVATPGRIVDHLRNGSAEWDLSRVKFLVWMKLYSRCVLSCL